MNDANDTNKQKLEYALGQSLDDLSVDEIEAIVSLLHDEIARLEETKAQKASHLSAAQALFSKN